MFKVHIITVSDSSYYENKKDLTGPALRDFLTEHSFEVCGYDIVPDEINPISNLLIEISDFQKVNLVITNGGTGFNKRDVTPEATLKIADKIVPGFGEEMRRRSLEITPFGILSRAVSVIRNQTLILNVPGSPKAAVENLGFIITAIPHALKILTNEKNDCAKVDDSR
ncbi:MAG: MogA/MoaB family molybdenum cofactor biosynthesis protein [Treponema phagedenis]|uniref:MogA/MoaB family molybdenum cofactor biosynthesis protein n=1 Tax=Treponema phagedenis TaxID=162 RepID=UPI0001F63D32|nr:MogA/MoaB family molybdenum cofactor biosynthesis protein [Treponema phagedenis]EFW37466.1 molybdenum cofactor synthesis domain protein [Treponema phagedenis F0421]TYT78280.1 MogA/MoaB family molybdenum cofactor biosynthesis protein [Treponema phagedenis]